MNPKPNRRVLIVDDNPAIHEDFRKILCAGPESGGALARAEAALFGEPQSLTASVAFEMDSAMQGREGLARVQQALQEGRPYSMAFIDVRMPPGWDGVETIAKIWEVYPDLQVVMCTAYSDYSWDEMLAKVGQSDRLVILKKPFDNVEALQLANTLTAKWQLIQQTRSQVHDLEERVRERTQEIESTQARLQAVIDGCNEMEVRLRHAQNMESIGKLGEEIPKAIQQSLEGVDRVARIVRSMKDLSRRPDHVGN